MKLSRDGYKRNSKDVNNPYNIIPSGDITMKDVDFPVMGTDNLGNQQLMQPGFDYKFPGNMVFEELAKEGGELPKAQRGIKPIVKTVPKIPIRPPKPIDISSVNSNVIKPKGFGSLNIQSNMLNKPITGLQEVPKYLNNNINFSNIDLSASSISNSNNTKPTVEPIPYYTTNLNNPNLPIEIINTLEKNRNYILSDEYINKRMVNTGEPPQFIELSIKKYLEAVDKTLFKLFKKGELGPTVNGQISTAKGIEIIGTNALEPIEKSIDYKKILEVIDHEIKHLLSPLSARLSTINPHEDFTWIDTRTGKQLTYEEAELITNVDHIDFVPSKQHSDWMQAHKHLYNPYVNYPRISVEGKTPEFAEYIHLPWEQQTRLLRFGEVLKKHGWDGTSDGLTNELINKTLSFNTSGKIVLGSSSEIPRDVIQLLGNMQGIDVGTQAWYRRIKKSVPYAWSLIPLSTFMLTETEEKTDEETEITEVYKKGGEKKEIDPDSISDTIMFDESTGKLYNKEIMDTWHQRRGKYDPGYIHDQDHYNNWKKKQEALALPIHAKSGGEQNRINKYKISPFDSSKLSLSNTNSLIDRLVSQGVFTEKFKIGGEQKFNNGYNIKKDFDKERNLPFISYNSEPSIEGRIYYDKDTLEQTNNFNLINVEDELIKKQNKHNKTKEIIIKYENGEDLTLIEKERLSSLGLLY